MPPYLALAICLCVVLALFVLDHRWRHAISIGGWIPIFWTLVQGCRPITTWFAPSEMSSLEAIYEGSPVDRAIYLALISAGLLVLITRRFNWFRFAAQNKWVAIYFAYLGISLLWSDYTFIAFKRWVKDLGNLIMVLVVISEANPLSAASGLFIRASYLIVPLSIVTMRYFPEVGRYFDQWGRANLSALAADKNMLGMTLTVFILAQVWGIIEAVNRKPNRGTRLEIATYLMLLIMSVWLLRAADCATGLAGSVVGSVTMLALGLGSVRRNVRVLVTLAIMAMAVAAVPEVRTSILEPIVGVLGRDLSFTGRDVVWRAVLAEEVNPWIGTGAYSFWMGDRIEVGIAGLEGANEAHNAYLEVYLNVGFIGLALYLAILASATRRVLRELRLGESVQANRFRLGFLIMTVMYGITEAVVRQNLIWLGLLLVVSRGSLLHGAQEALASHESSSGRQTARPLAMAPAPAGASQRLGAASRQPSIGNWTGGRRSRARKLDLRKRWTK